jgi:hypothetical protein
MAFEKEPNQINQKRYDRIHAWERSELEFCFWDQNGNDISGRVEVEHMPTNVVYPKAPPLLAELRTMEVSDSKPMSVYKGHEYKISGLFQDSDDGAEQRVSLHHSSILHHKGYRYVVSYPSMLDSQTLDNPEARSQICFVVNRSQAGPSQPTVLGSRKTNAHEPQFQILSGDGGIIVFRYRVDGADWKIVGPQEERLEDSADMEGTRLFLSGNWPEGEYLLEVQERNMIGMWSDSEQVYFEVDRSAPQAPSFTNSTDHGDPMPTWSWKTTESGIVRFSFDPQMETSAVDEHFNSGSVLSNYQALQGLTIGSHTLYLQERDIAGNWSEVVSSTIQISYDSIAAPNLFGPSITRSRQPVIHWSSGGGGLAQYRVAVDRESVDSAAVTESESMIWNLDLADGLHRLTVAERDEYNNWSSNTLSLMVDGTEPDLEWFSPRDGALLSSSNVLHIDIKVRDVLSDLNIKRSQCLLDGQVLEWTAQTSSDQKEAHIQAIVEGLKSGPHEIEVQFQDELGNVVRNMRRIWIKGEQEQLVFVDLKGGKDDNDGQALVGAYGHPSTGPVKTLSRAFELVAGINEAEIILMSGQYIGLKNRNLEHKSGNLSIKGFVDVMPVVIDMQQASDARAFVVSGGHLNLSELVIRGGHSQQGGAIFLSGGHLQLQKMRFEDNQAMEGGAICVIGGSVDMEDTTVFRNLSHGNGAGLMLDTREVVRVQRTRFIENQALGYGGAIYEK